MLDVVKFAVLDIGPILSIAVFAVGLSRLIIWALSPREELPTPEPRAANLARGIISVASNVMLMRAVFIIDKWLWVSSVVFHASLTLALIGHLRGFGLALIEQAIAALGPASSFVKNELPFLVGVVFMVAITGTIVRRLVVEEARLASDISDYALALLILAIGVTGTVMRLAQSPEPLSVSLALGSLSLSLDHSPPLAILYLHAALAEVLIAILPFSKLAHAVTGIFTSAIHGATLPRSEGA